MDLWHTALKFADHHRYKLAALALSAVSLAVLACASTTAGLADAGGPPGAKVDRATLERQAVAAGASLTAERADLDAKVAAFNARAEAHNQALDLARADLDRQDTIKREILATLGAGVIDAAAGRGNPLSLIAPALSVLSIPLAIGSAADSRRAGKVIRNLKERTTIAGTIRPGGEA